MFESVSGIFSASRGFVDDVAVSRSSGKKGVVSPSVTYRIADKLNSPATSVIFLAAPKADICLKLWLPCNNEVYDTRAISACTAYLLEGLAFNRQFAPQIYYGIVPVLKQDEQSIQCGPLITNPEADNLEQGISYALMMKRLPEDWRLDHQLHNGSLRNCGGLSFLAKSVADIHFRLEPVPADLALPIHIAEKLSLNRRVFDQALQVLIHKNLTMEAYKPVGDFMERAYRKLTKLFEQRAREGHIKRCHGDLKATNLWLQPSGSAYLGLKKTMPKLLPLDCVDFNPKFCNIDTLSDVAMLAIDLEMRLVGSWTNAVKHRERTQIKTFLTTYLNSMQEPEREDIWLLLEYYMTEKAMICAYMSILYDGLPTLGKRYLDVARDHAQKLSARLHIPLIPRRKTVPLEPLTPDTANPRLLASSSRRSGSR